VIDAIAAAGGVAGDVAVSDKPCDGFGSMNLDKAIQELRLEKQRIERAIASLEELHRSAAVVPPLAPRVQRRGRKFMGPQERQEVSQRMKKYWAARRKKP
jgi:hypothetical protein